MADAEPLMFPDSPVVRLYDPLGEVLGAGDGVYTYRFDDAVKLAGHACPTVAGAFLMARRALELLYGDELPQRGDLRVTLHGQPDAGVNGPISQVLTLLTGAAPENGFQGLGGQHVRKGLMAFAGDGAAFVAGVTFERSATGARVTLRYDPSAIPPAPTMGPDLQAVLSGTADVSVQQRFRDAWRGRVERILADGGAQTVRQVE
ncbi:MAG TPA: hypothetical protein VGB12_13145 [bacterium]|jgi:hypothetical protein